MCDNFDCPYCRQRGVSLLRKLCLGPAQSTKCKSCRRKISVSPASFVAGLPVAFSIGVVHLTGSMSFLALVPLMLVVSTLVHLYAVPMVPK